MAAQSDAETADTQEAQHSEGEPRPSAGRNLERHDPEYLDRDQLDFDPDEGLYSGTAVDGTSDIPGPHADGTADGAESGSAGESGDSESADSESADSERAEGESAEGASGIDAGDGGGADSTGEGR